jgi:hypothetical protein
MIVSIKGIKIEVQLLTKEEYIKKHTDDSVGHFDKIDRALVFREDIIKKNVVIHEVVHAFIHGCHLSSCNDLTVEDFEEIVCEMLEDHLMDIENTSKKILKYLESVSSAL